MHNISSNTTESRILVAAEEEFLDRGYDGARTVSIAERAGVTHAMLHYYFRSKEQLFQRILDEKINILVHSVLTAFFQSDRPFLQRVEEGIAAHFDFLAANEKLPLFVVREIGKQGNSFLERIKNIASERLVTMQAELDALAAEGAIRKISAPMLIMDIVSQNIFPFLVLPTALELFPEKDKAAFLEQVKQENIRLILSRLKA